MILPTWVFFRYLSPSLRRLCQNQYYLNERSWTVNKTSWSNPRQTRISLLYFSPPSYYKSSVETNFPILLSHFRIRIVVLTFPDNKSARNHQPKSCVPEKSHKNHNDARPILFQLKCSLPFSLFLFVWRLESTTTKSLLRHLHCRGSPLFKSRR